MGLHVQTDTVKIERGEMPGFRYADARSRASFRNLLCLYGTEYTNRRYWTVRYLGAYNRGRKVMRRPTEFSIRGTRWRSV